MNKMKRSNEPIEIAIWQPDRNDKVLLFRGGDSLVSALSEAPARMAIPLTRLTETAFSLSRQYSVMPSSKAPEQPFRRLACDWCINWDTRFNGNRTCFASEEMFVHWPGGYSISTACGSLMRKERNMRSWSGPRHPYLVMRSGFDSIYIRISCNNIL